MHAVPANDVGCIVKNNARMCLRDAMHTRHLLFVYLATCFATCRLPLAAGPHAVLPIACGRVWLPGRGCHPITWGAWRGVQPEWLLASTSVAVSNLPGRTPAVWRDRGWGCRSGNQQMLNVHCKLSRAPVLSVLAYVMAASKVASKTFY